MIKTVTNTVSEVLPDSPAFLAGIVRGDKILSINGKAIHDELDLIFYSKESSLKVKFKRGRNVLNILIEKEDDEDTGIVIEPLIIKTCNNNCIFCFVNQLPRGLRKSLYTKDEDYRFSFLYGNYVTLSNLSVKDKKRIFEQKLSPLYISVHTTNHELRKTILGNRKISNILTELKTLKAHKIKFHTQIVLCPGYTDNDELENTIHDLGKFYPYMISIAVVPVGLTKHMRRPLNEVTTEDAKRALNIIEKFQKRFMKKYGDPLVYGSDELFIKANSLFPPIKLYRDFPQIENGVGMVPQFVHASKFVRFSSHKFLRKKFTTFTGESFFPFLTQFIDKTRQKTDLDIRLIPVTNLFFGNTVTVTGLLTGRDIIKSLSDSLEGSDVVLIPDVVLKDSHEVLLDDISVVDIREALNTEVRVIESTPVGLLRGLEDNYAY